MDNQYHDIYRYIYFRKYLRAYQKARYKIDRGFSGAGICKMLGLENTRTYFSDMLFGKTLTLNFTEKMIKILNLKKNEAMYFRLMVHYDRSVSREEKRFLKAEMEILRKKKNRRL